MAYVEPFAGMLGVLLQRPRAAAELINDADGNLVAWWRAVRDTPDRLAHHLRYTPYARAEYVNATSVLRSDDATQLERAVAVHVVLYQGIGRNLNATPGQWSRTRKPVDKTGYLEAVDAQIQSLAGRLRSVQIEHGDAVELLAWAGAEPSAIVYADPPYRGVYRPYAHAVDFDALEAVLRDCHARVAVSGYDDDWDALGWERHERATHTVPASRHAGRERVEVLWTNYAATAQERML